jgi:hypothetical protein
MQLRSPLFAAIFLHPTHNALQKGFALPSGLDVTA